MMIPFGNSTHKSARNARGGEVAVVGGSAAGFFTACLLARGGASVSVLEREESLEPVERTLIVTHRMRSLLGRSADGCVVNEIRRFELFTDGRSATISLKQPDLIVERASLIRGLARLNSWGRRKRREKASVCGRRCLIRSRMA
jgi:flavin-dependent dehydrogenase